MNEKTLATGTDSHGLFSRFKRTSAGVLDRAINRVEIDIKLDSENWQDLGSELEEMAKNLSNAALLASAFAIDALSIGKAFAGISLMKEADERGSDWLIEILEEAKKSDGSEFLHSKDYTPEIP